MNLTYREMMVLIRIINRYLEDHPSGESAEEGRKILEKMEQVAK